MNFKIYELYKTFYFSQRPKQILVYQIHYIAGGNGHLRRNFINKNNDIVISANFA